MSAGGHLPITRTREIADDSPDGRQVILTRLRWQGSSYREVLVDAPRGGTLFIVPGKLRDIAASLTAAADWLDGHWDDEVERGTHGEVPNEWLRQPAEDATVSDGGVW